jgi:hypothetical protein
MSLKGFGDLTIARTSQAACPQSAGLAIARHQVELNATLRPGPAAYVVETGEPSVPALFDLRNRGIGRGLRSAVSLRHAVRRAGIPASSTLVFDKLGPREQFIALGSRAVALPFQANIYLAYAELLSGSRDTTLIANSWQTAGIFPSSRVAAKNLPSAVVTQLVAHCRASGLRPQVFLLDGERPELEAAFPDATIVPRRFAALAEAVRNAGVIISADSLPAHLAEHWLHPVFVVSPVDNRYWLPLSAYQHDRWTVFDHLDDGRLTTFLDSCTASASAPSKTALIR